MTTLASHESSSLEQTITRMAGLLRGRGALSTGDVAMLRRMDPRQPAAAFFKLQGLMFDDQLPGTAGVLLDFETRWAVVAQGLACLGTLHRASPSTQLGLVLAASGFSEVRFVRLLAADAARLVDELPTLARFLTAKSMFVDWTGAAHLILSAGRVDREPQRRRVARDYYGALARQDHH